MDAKIENSDEVVKPSLIKRHFPTFHHHWNGLNRLNKTLVKLLAVAIIVAAIPLTVKLSEKPQNSSSNAAGITYTVPSSIDATGGTDVSSALQSWINSLPNGTASSPTIAIFPSGAIYKISNPGSGLIIDNRSYIYFQGSGATIKELGGGNNSDSVFRIGWASPSNNIKISGFTMIGANPDGATEKAYHVGLESQQGIHLYSHPGSHDIEIYSNTITDMYGHAVYIRSDALPYPDNINIHDNIIKRMGVMGVAIANGTNITVKNNQIIDTALYPIDIEDGQSGQPVQNILIQGNTLNGWSWSPAYTAHVITGDGSTGMSWNNVVVDSNILEGGDKGTSTTNSTSGPISFWGSDTKNNLQVTNNISQVPVDGWASRFNNINGLTVTGNNFPGVSGGATDIVAQITSSSNVTYNPNPPAPTPTPASATATPTQKPTPTLIITPTPTNAPTPVPTKTPTPSPTAVPSPNLSITSGPTATNITNTTAVITWYLSTYATGQVQYGTTTNYGLVSAPETSFNYNYHVQAISGLTAGTIYHYRVISTNQSGVTIYSSDQTFLTTGGAIPTPTPKPTPTATPTPTPIVNTSLTVGSIAVSGITSSNANVSWYPSRPATGQVQYGTTTNYGLTSTLEVNYLTYHKQTLSNLSANTTYHFRVVSKDQNGNTAVSGDNTFKTIRSCTQFLFWKFCSN